MECIGLGTFYFVVAVLLFLFPASAPEEKKHSAALQPIPCSTDKNIETYFPGKGEKTSFLDHSVVAKAANRL